MSIMLCSRSCAAQLASATGGILLMLSAASLAQTTAPAASPVQAPGLECNGDPKMVDPFRGKLADPGLPPRLLPVDPASKEKVLKSGLPCQENVSPVGIEASGLENLQRGFDFYSWRTFIALNSPADGTPIDSEKAQTDTPTKWEDMNNFKQLLDVMLPADQQPPIWPADTDGMRAERERLMPQACRDLLNARPDLMKDAPNRMIVKMIEESFNEPFKTGPLIDQHGHYAIFDILMNRQMFKYITENHLNTKAGQAANADLAVDFPAGQNDCRGSRQLQFGSFMLKVSWKIFDARRNRGEDLPHEESARPDASRTRSGRVWTGPWV